MDQRETGFVRRILEAFIRTNFKFAPIFDWLMALFRNHEYMWNAIFDEFLAEWRRRGALGNGYLLRVTFVGILT